MRLTILLFVALTACRPAEKSPPATVDSVASADSVPPDVFAILAPTTRDTLVEGSTFVIRWRAPGIAKINLGAAMGGHDKGYLLNGAPSVPDSLVWPIPVGFVTGFGPTASSDMRLRLEDAGDPAHYVETGPFTIVARH